MTIALVFLGIVLLILAFALIIVAQVAIVAIQAIKSEWPTIKRFMSDSDHSIKEG